jgi:hypothetical protein
MIISLKHIPNQYPPISLNNTQISTVTEHIELGLTLTNKMSWQQHIDKLVKKGSKRVAILCRIRYKLPRSALECTLHQSEILESVQRKAALICSGAYRHTEHKTLLSELGWDTLQTRRHNQKLTMYYKMSNDLVPPYLTRTLTNQNTNITNYRLRNHNNRQIPKTRTTMYTNSFIPSSTKSWNALPVQLRNTPILNTFKNKINNKSKLTKNNYYTKYSKKTGIWLSRLRMGLSALNSHRFTHNFIASPQCDHCHSGNETTKHYFFLCHAYAAQCLTLLNNLDIYIGIDIYNKEEMQKTILHGNVPTNKIEHHINITTEYLNSTKRFK